jgi:hypothetical protein
MGGICSKGPANETYKLLYSADHGEVAEAVKSGGGGDSGGGRGGGSSSSSKTASTQPSTTPSPNNKSRKKAKCSGPSSPIGEAKIHFSDDTTTADGRTADTFNSKKQFKRTQSGLKRGP